VLQIANLGSIQEHSKPFTLTGDGAVFIFHRFSSTRFSISMFHDCDSETDRNELKENLGGEQKRERKYFTNNRAGNCKSEDC